MNVSLLIDNEKIADLSCSNFSGMCNHSETFLSTSSERYFFSNWINIQWWTAIGMVLLFPRFYSSFFIQFYKLTIRDRKSSKQKLHSMLVWSGWWTTTMINKKANSSLLFFMFLFLLEKKKRKTSEGFLQFFSFCLFVSFVFYMKKTNKLNTMTRTMTREVQRIKQRKKENNENDAYLNCSSF